MRSHAQTVSSAGTAFYDLKPEEPVQFSSPELSRIEDNLFIHDMDFYNSQKLLVVAYDKNSFYVTQEVKEVEQAYEEYLTLERTVQDHSEPVVSDIFGCENAPDYSEDGCLETCLLKRSMEDLKCLHPRLVWLHQRTHGQV